MFFDTAFGAYAKHQTELDNIAQKIVDTYRQTGNTQIKIDIDDDLSEEDMKYIEKQVKKFVV